MDGCYLAFALTALASNTCASGDVRHGGCRSSLRRCLGNPFEFQVELDIFFVFHLKTLLVQWFTCQALQKAWVKTIHGVA